MALIRQGEILDQIYAEVAAVPELLARAEADSAVDKVDVARLKRARQGKIGRVGGEAVVIVSQKEFLDDRAGWVKQRGSIICLATGLSDKEASVLYSLAVLDPKRYLDFGIAGKEKEYPIFVNRGRLADVVGQTGEMVEVRQYSADGGANLEKDVAKGAELEKGIGLPLFADLERDQDVLACMMRHKEVRPVLEEARAKFRGLVGKSLLRTDKHDFSRVWAFNLGVVLDQKKPARKGKAVVLVVEYEGGNPRRAGKGDLVLASGLSEKAAHRMMHEVAKDHDRYHAYEKNGMRVTRVVAVEVKSATEVMPIPVIGDMRSAGAYAGLAEYLRGLDAREEELAAQQFMAAQREMAAAGAGLG